MAEPKMEYIRLGQSGLKISKIILGTMSYGDPAWEGWIKNEEESLPLLEHAYKMGINTWDTADLYSNGKSEEIIGKALRKYKIPRERVVILTKCYYPVNPAEVEQSGAASSITDDLMVNRQGLSRKYIFDAVDASVRRLGTYIDLLQIHRLDRDTPAEEIMRALNDVVESGKVRYLGASSMAAWELQKLQNVAERHGWHRFVSYQDYHNLLYRENEREHIPYCAAAGIGLIPWSPLAKGVLARPWQSRSSTREATDASIEAWYRRGGGDGGGSGDDTADGAEDVSSSADQAIVGRVEQVARARGVEMAAVAMAWMLGREPVMAPIVGLSSAQRIDRACAAVHLRLSADEVKFLEEPYRPKNLMPLF